ncbi:MAG TPA: glycosyltransferase [Tepidisphaeraceae bacterium]|jgi:glycosyltransferase involved in cell wall biosynthesis|nr:glycosyltransferase [Tepidisphaeraceae bacterium]
MADKELVSALKVCHFISGLDPINGGPAVAMAGLAPAELRAGLDVSVAATWVDHPGHDQAQKMRDAGVKVHLLGPCTNPMSRHPELAKWVDDLVAGCDVVHIHALFEEIQHQAARAAWLRKIPYVIRPCGMLDPWSLRQAKWKKKLYMAWRLRRNLNRAAGLHFTAALEADLTKPLHLKAPSIVEPNGVNLREFQDLPAPGTFREKHPELKGKKIVLFLSRIHPKKGLDLLIPAFARANLSDAMFVIAGPDAEGYGPTVQKLIADYHLQDRVMVVGPIYGSDRVAALTDADIFALPSYSENFGIAVVEALAAGRPVIISDQINIHAEITAAGVGAVIPLDIDRLAAELQRWLGDEGLRNRAAGKARPFVWETYDWDRIARRWSEHYINIATNRA